MSRASLLALLVCVATASANGRRAQLATQLADEAAVIDKTLATVGDKVREAEGVRAQRLRAAYRVLRAPLPHGASPADRMAAARRRAAARMLVDRDAHERALLVDESALLRAAAERTVTAAAKLPEIALPDRLVRPVRGSIARKFGTLVHERSKATLARRGLDFDVDLRATVSAPAAGTVRYAGPIRGLDNGIVLDHGDYFTVIAKLGELTVPLGAELQAGDRLGRAARERVYLELRVRIGPGGIPIDPEPLLASPDDD